MINESTKDIMLSFEEKLREPSSKERAMVWYPRAKKIQQLTEDILSYIDSIKRNLDSKATFSSDLFEKLVQYKKEVLSVDPKINHEFQKSLRLFTRTIDSSVTNQKKLLQNYFNDISAIAALAMLNKLQNNIKVIEWKITTYCHDNVGYLDGPGFYSVTTPIISLSSTVVQPGESIQIFAGLGSMNTDQKPEILIYGKSVPLYYDGAAHYELNASSKPGNYHVPIQISYTDLDGRRQTYQKGIEYTVANIQKQ